jgi:hypothetical protein
MGGFKEWAGRFMADLNYGGFMARIYGGFMADLWRADLWRIYGGRIYGTRGEYEPMKLMK